MNGLYHTIDLLPLVFAGGSFLILIVSTICTKRGAKNKGRDPDHTPPKLYFEVTRVVMSIFLSLTIAIAWRHQNVRPSGSRAVGGTLYITVAYGILLTLLSALASGLEFGSNQLTRHADLVYLCVFGAIAYHDLWPFFTFEGLTHQLDLYNAVEVALLGILGIIIPLTSPREYQPVYDTPHPKEPHPEQTASWLSLLLYSWLDPLISVAYKSQHLAPDALFPLADYDHVAQLVSRHATHFKSRGVHNSHIFFGLIKAFSSEYVTLVFLVLVQVIANLVNPIALEQFLRYLETQGKGATIRPIVWIILLFLGPIAFSISYQWSIFIETRVAVRMEALLSDLVFKHALRIRLQGGERNGASADGNSPSNQPNLVGTINNHVTTDLTNVTEAKDFVPIVVGVPVQIILCLVLLHKILGWSALVGAAAMVVLFPVPGYITSLFQGVEAEKMKKTDGRVQLVSETMNVLRMIKLFGWERKINSRIQDQRIEELVWTRNSSLLQLLNQMTIFIVPIVAMLVTFSVYTLVARQNLTASIVFSSMAVFSILQTQLHMVARSMRCLIQGKVALDRINTFLSHDDTVCELPGTEPSIPHSAGDDDIVFDNVGISHATFSWSKLEPSTGTPRNKHFTLVVQDELAFQHKGLNLITGPTGSGKTSLLMALLGEMHFHPSGPSSWCTLPRHLGVAYAAQESWILNRTIRDNVLFGSDFDEGRYIEVLSQCALEPDLARMEHGDLTEVGERGVTLSGGQKARVTLARAIYSSAQILLLDDVFAALDVHTSQWIVNNCFRGKLVAGRTIIMATHNVSLLSGIARYVVTLDNEGQVRNHGPTKADAVGDTNVVGTDQGRTLEIDDPAGDSTSTLGNKLSSAEVEGGTLTTAEEIAEGHVGWPAVMLYLLGWGGRTPVLNWGLFVFGLSATHISKSAQSWYLGYWAEQYQGPSAVNVGYNVMVYTLIMCLTVIIYSLSQTVNLLGSLRASKIIHERLVERIFGATFRWLDTTPVARVITRCTQDIGTVDGTFPMSLSVLVELTIAMSVHLAAVVYLAPPFALPGLIVAIIGGWCGQVYMKAELSVKRELSNAKTPLLAHLGASLAGLVSVRAFGAQDLFIKEYHLSIDHYTRVARTFHAFNCWVSVRLEALGALFAATLAAYLMYGHHNINPSNAGFSLDMAVNFSGLILWWIIMFNNTEINGNSLERIADYMEIEQEAEPINKARPPAYWPASGDLRVENLSARYSMDGPRVLHNLSFHIRTGERIGIVGRTGSGKTSLTLSLLRCLPTEGEVYYDGILTSSLDLEVLRSSLAIIPQSADLLDGTIRQNLDPFDQFDDAILHDALRSAGLSELQQLSDGDDDNINNNRLTLDTAVTAGGTNLSVGQRQIVALARAMVRESKLLVLDEATSAIDHKTDAAIQRSLREIRGVTQLVIAHRLHSVMDADRIMALDAGRIVEFDTPSRLLQREESIFRALVHASKDREALLAMVNHSG